MTEAMQKLLIEKVSLVLLVAIIAYFWFRWSRDD